MVNRVSTIDVWSTAILTLERAALSDRMAVSHQAEENFRAAEAVHHQWYGKRCETLASDVKKMSNTKLITILERLTRVTITVSWGDPTMCRYGSQTWCHGFAKKAAVCAKSGRTICRGDAIYRPHSRVGGIPMNVNEMILASVVEESFETAQ
jgi:hypothetical protein